MSEPPSSGLLVAASPVASLVPLELSGSAVILRILAAILLLALALGATVMIRLLTGLNGAVSNGANKNATTAPPLKSLLANLPETVTSLRLARVLAAIAFAWTVVPPVGALISNLLPTGTTAATLAPVVTVVFIGVIYLAAVDQLGARLAAQRGDRLVYLLARPSQVWRVVSSPATRIAGWLAEQVTGGSKEDDRSRSAQALKAQPDHEHARFDALDERESQLISNVFAFGDAVASELMVPRPDVVWIATNNDFKEVLDQVLASGHTRFPLCEGSPDRVVGYVHVKDLARMHDEPPTHRDWARLMRPVTFVPETAKAVTLLTRFQQERAHLAVVVDEFGGMAGIITLEDLLEELVGDIQDEFDRDEPEVQDLGRGELMVDGGVRLEVLRDQLGLDLERVEEETLGGYIFARLAREIAVGDNVSVPGGMLVAEAVEGLRVTRVRFVPGGGEAQQSVGPADRPTERR